MKMKSSITLLEHDTMNAEECLPVFCLHVQGGESKKGKENRNIVKNRGQEI
jgi:hypothetical protein